MYIKNMITKTNCKYYIQHTIIHKFDVYLLPGLLYVQNPFSIENFNCCFNDFLSYLTCTNTKCNLHITNSLATVSMNLTHRMLFQVLNLMSIFHCFVIPLHTIKAGEKLLDSCSQLTTVYINIFAATIHICTPCPLSGT